PGDADADLVVGTADVVDPPPVILGGLVAKERLERHGARHRPDGGAVPGTDIVEPVGKPHAAAAFHVLRQDRWITRNVLAEMAGDHPRVEIIAAADADIDVEIDGFAAVEIGL